MILGYSIDIHKADMQVKACLAAAALGREFIPATLGAQEAADEAAAKKMDAAMKLARGEVDEPEVDRDSIARKLSQKEVRSLEAVWSIALRQ